MVIDGESQSRIPILPCFLGFVCFIDMVNDGSSPRLGDGLAEVKFERERIRLPVHIVEGANHPRLIGKNPIACWVLIVTPGRYRLVMQPTGAATGDLAKILQEIEEAV